MRRSGFLSAFLLLLPAALTLAAPAPAPAGKKSAPAPAVKPAAKPAPTPVQPIFPEVIFAPIFRAKQDPQTFADPAHASELFLAREKLIQDLLAERRRILTTDPKAREIHAQIMELNKQLAVVLESKRAVRELNRDLMLVDARINSLERKPITQKKAAPASNAKAQTPGSAPADKPAALTPAAAQQTAVQPAKQDTAK